MTFWSRCSATLRPPISAFVRCRRDRDRARKRREAERGAGDRQISLQRRRDLGTRRLPGRERAGANPGDDSATWRSVLQGEAALQCCSAMTPTSLAARWPRAGIPVARRRSRRRRHPRRPVAPPPGRARRRAQGDGAERSDRHRGGRSFPGLQLAGVLARSCRPPTARRSTRCSPSGRSFAFGPTFSWPILNYGQITNNVRVQDAELQALLIAYKNTVLKRSVTSRTALPALQGRQQVGVARQSVAAANNALRIALDRVSARHSRLHHRADGGAEPLHAQVDLRSRSATLSTSLTRTLQGARRRLADARRQRIRDDATRDEMRNRTNWGDLLPPAGPPSRRTPACPAPWTAGRISGPAMVSAVKRSTLAHSLVVLRDVRLRLALVGVVVLAAAAMSGHAELAFAACWTSWGERPAPKPAPATSRAVDPGDIRRRPLRTAAASSTLQRPTPQPPRRLRPPRARRAVRCAPSIPVVQPKTRPRRNHDGFGQCRRGQSGQADRPRARLSRADPFRGWRAGQEGRPAADHPAGSVQGAAPAGARTASGRDRRARSTPRSKSRATPLCSSSDAASQVDVDHWNFEEQSAEANILGRQAQIAIAKLNLGYTEVRAPFDGQMGKHLSTPAMSSAATGRTRAGRHHAARSDLCRRQHQLRTRHLQIRANLDQRRLTLDELHKVPVEVGAVRRDRLSAPRHARVRRAGIDPATGTLYVRGILPMPTTRCSPACS